MVNLLYLIFPVNFMTKGAYSNMWAGPQLDFTRQKLPDPWSFQHQ